MCRRWCGPAKSQKSPNPALAAPVCTGCGAWGDGSAAKESVKMFITDEFDCCHEVRDGEGLERGILAAQAAEVSGIEQQ